jgi:uncharacterized membrane protein
MELEREPDHSCLKCGHPRTSADSGPADTCPKCGAVYAKVEAALKARKQAGTQRIAAKIEKIQHGEELKQDFRRRWVAHLIYLLYIIPTGASAVIGISLARLLLPTEEDDLAAAHYRWQLSRMTRLVVVGFFLNIVALVLAAIFLRSLLLRDQGIGFEGMGFALKGWWVLMGVALAIYLVFILRMARGWWLLWKGEYP